jgi:tRNA U34 5-carboxymethylaminomethyl modifying enzyme MnmG/GidA
LGHTAEGKKFFQQNSKELFSHMNQAGINMSELKVDSPANTAKNEFDFNQQNSSRQGSEGKQQFGSESNQRRHDSDRRQDLWKLLADKEAA